MKIRNYELNLFIRKRQPNGKYKDIEIVEFGIRSFETPYDALIKCLQMTDWYVNQKYNFLPEYDKMYTENAEGADAFATYNNKEYLFDVITLTDDIDCPLCDKGKIQYIEDIEIYLCSDCDLEFDMILTENNTHNWHDCFPTEEKQLNYDRN